MDKKINVVNLNSQMRDIKAIVDLPSICPRCHVSYAGIPKYSCFADHVERGCDEYPRVGFLYSLHFCPHCEKCFLSEYMVKTSSSLIVQTHLVRSYPPLDTEKEFSRAITVLSPDFVEIYHQSEAAENAGLSRICGFGYRKALEFLIKDYAIYKNPGQEDTIKGEALAVCIKKYIDSEYLKDLATASAWLGNDEAHYIRKHTDCGLVELKLFLQTAVSTINALLAHESARQLLGTRK